MLAGIKFISVFAVVYAAVCGSIWGSAEASTFFVDKTIRESLGGYWWIIFYLIPVPISLFISAKTYKKPFFTEDNADNQMERLIAVVDKFNTVVNQIPVVVWNAPEGSPEQHYMTIEGRGRNELVSVEAGKVVKTITSKDLETLAADQREHLSVLEKSMMKNYKKWARWYPLRNLSWWSVVNSRINKRLKQLVFDMGEDLNGIMSYLELLGVRLDDHYLMIRNLVTQSSSASGLD